jgi:hypothetical protein
VLAAKLAVLLVKVESVPVEVVCPVILAPFVLPSTRLQCELPLTFVRQKYVSTPSGVEFTYVAVEGIEAAKSREISRLVAAKVPLHHMSKSWHGEWTATGKTLLSAVYCPYLSDSVAFVAPRVHHLGKGGFIQRQAVRCVGNPVVDASVDRLAPCQDGSASRRAGRLHIVLREADTTGPHGVEGGGFDLVAIRVAKVIEAEVIDDRHEKMFRAGDSSRSGGAAAGGGSSRLLSGGVVACCCTTVEQR